MSKKNRNTLIMSLYSDIRFPSKDKIISAGSNDIITVSTHQELDTYLSNPGDLDLVICDMDLGKEMITESMGKVRARFPNVYLVVASNDVIPNEVEKLNPWKLIEKSIINSELIYVLNDTIEEHQCQVKSDGSCESKVNGTGWEKVDEKGIRIYMSRILSELDAQEAIICFRDGKLIKTENPGIGGNNDTYQALLNDLSQGENGEVLRILKIDSSDYLIHGCILKDNIVLGLVYSIDTPFSLVRKQSWYFREMFKELNPINHVTVSPKNLFNQGNWKFDRHSEYPMTLPSKKFIPWLATRERKIFPVAESRKNVKNNSQAVQ